jgi:TonB family protein
MFETAVVRARAADRRWLPLSVFAHVTIVAAVIVASLTSTRLPENAPKQMMPVFFERPLPVMSAPAQPRPVPHVAAAPPRGNAAGAVGQARLPVLHLIPTPAIIPSTIPNIDSVPSSGPAGVESGHENSTGNDAGAPPAADASGPLVAGTGGVTSPTVLRRVEPVYPLVALHARMPGVVVLQCVIDKTGRIRDVHVVRSSFGAFDQPAIDAVQQWLFSPGTLNGQPVDVIFELTVRFEVR